METTNNKDGIPNTFVSARDLLFLSFADALAYQIGAKHIIIGVRETDSSGCPGCCDSFIKSINVILSPAMDKDFVVHTLLMWLNEIETWKLSDELEASDYTRTETLTCYNGITGDGCGECSACHSRQRGLNQYLESRGAL